MAGLYSRVHHGSENARVTALLNRMSESHKQNADQNIMLQEDADSSTSFLQEFKGMRGN